MKSKVLPHAGICVTVYSSLQPKFDDILQMIRPTPQELEQHIKEEGDFVYWGSTREEREEYIKKFGRKPFMKICRFLAENDLDAACKIYAYTPLRQTMVLLCHEILNNG